MFDCVSWKTPLATCFSTNAIVPWPPCVAFIALLSLWLRLRCRLRCRLRYRLSVGFRKRLVGHRSMRARGDAHEHLLDVGNRFELLLQRVPVERCGRATFRIDEAALHRDPHARAVECMRVREARVNRAGDIRVV